MTYNNNNNKGVRSYVWLLMALFCIVFSSASKRVIELKVNPADYSTAAAFNKKIKDGSRDKRESLNAMVHANHGHSADNSFADLFLLSSLVSFALLYFSRGNSPIVADGEQRLVLAGIRPIYLQHHRLQV